MTLKRSLALALSASCVLITGAAAQSLSPNTPAYQDPATGSFYYYDQASGYFFDPDNGYYYDAAANTFYRSSTAAGPVPQAPAPLNPSASAVGEPPVYSPPYSPSYAQPYAQPYTQPYPDSPPQTLYVPVPTYVPGPGFRQDRRREDADRRAAYERERAAETQRQNAEAAQRRAMDAQHQNAEAARHRVEDTQRHAAEAQQRAALGQLHAVPGVQAPTQGQQNQHGGNGCSRNQDPHCR
jgi:OCRE domain